MTTTEIVLARVLVDWLKRQGHAVYQEVPVEAHGRRWTADVISIEGPWICCYETKLGLTDTLIAQCKGRRHALHRIYAVVPVQTSGTPDAVLRMLRFHRIGLVCVDGSVSVQAPAPVNMEAEIAPVVEALTLRQRPGFPPAGSSGSKRMHQDGLDQARRVIGEKPGVGGKELRLELNWSEAELRGFLKHVRAGAVAGIRAEGAPAALYLDRL